MKNVTALKWIGALTGLALVAGASPNVQDAPRVWLTSDLIGMKVVSPQGDSLGKIEDVVVHPGGDTAYAVLSFGGWLGMGEKLFAMPWSVLRSVERDTAKPDSERSLVLPLDKAKLKQAPGFDKKNWPAMANPEWSKDIDSFYAGGTNPNTRQPIEAAARTSLITWKVSDLRGTDVETPDGDDLGEIKELAIDTNGRVSYVAMELDGSAGGADRLIAVPWDAFEFSLSGDKGDEKHVKLASTRMQLEQAPLFLTGESHRAEMCDPKWVARVHSHFARPPYWLHKGKPVGSAGSGS